MAGCASRRALHRTSGRCCRWNFTGEEVPDALRPYLPGWAWLESFALDIDGQELVAEPRRIADGGKVDEESVAWTAPLFLSKVLGRFPEDAKAGVLPCTWIIRTRGDDATAKIGPFRLPVELGVDVGASDNGDFTVSRERRGMRAGRRWDGAIERPREGADPQAPRAVTGRRRCAPAGVLGAAGEQG